MPANKLVQEYKVMKKIKETFCKLTGCRTWEQAKSEYPQKTTAEAPECFKGREMFDSTASCSENMRFLAPKRNENC
jgi:hypothetical protein